MPLRIILFIVSLWLIGSGITFILLTRCYLCFLRGKSGFHKVREVGVLVFFAFSVCWLTYIFLPCFSLFGKVFCQGPRHEKIIALTFDDGPNEPYTSQILDILKQSQVPAAFFLVGKNATRSPATVSRMFREGYIVGNHTYTHQPLLWKGESGIEKEIEDWESVVLPLGKPLLKLFRAPHGWKPPGLYPVLKKRGYQLIGWTRGVWDTDQPTADILFRRLTASLQNGEIILLHDGKNTEINVDRSELVKVLPRIIRFYRDQGFRFVSLSEMMSLND